MLNFIRSHANTLEVLDLTDHHLPSEHKFDTDSFPFTRDFDQQPHLKTFKGGAHMFLRLLNSSLQPMFTRLENLELDDREIPRSDLTEDFWLQRDGQQMHTLPNLRRLCLDVYYAPIPLEEEPKNKWLTWIHQFLERCQARLETLTLRLPYAIDAEVLAAFLSQADSLETIYLSRMITREYEDERYVNILSTNCKNLQEVWLSYGKWSESYVGPFDDLGTSASLVRIKRDNFGKAVDLQVDKIPHR
jgi:hypothetical protein